MQALLIWLARQCRWFGWRGASVVLLELGSVFSAQRSIAFQLVIDLLVLGRVQRARQKVLAARSNSNDLASFEGQDNRILAYMNWRDFSDQLGKDLVDSRAQLASFLSDSRGFIKDLPHDLSVFTDYVLVSNARIRLSRSEIDCLKGMRSPVFVFLNHANPAFQRLLLKEGLGDIPHLLFAGKNGLVNQDLRLIYKSYGIHSFNLIACLIRNGCNPHFEKYFLADIVASNRDVPIFCIDELASLVDCFYADHSFLAADGFMPMPSLGWLVIEFFSALVGMRDNANDGDADITKSIWLAGFDLSPSYVFESNFKCVIHDFVYEYAALNVRLANGLFRKIGSPDRNRRQRRPPPKRLTNKQMWALRGPDSRSES